MLATFVIGLREGLEAALIVGIIAAFLKQSNRPDALRKVWLGVAAAIVLCLAVGVALQVFNSSLPQRQQEMLECIVAAIAVVMVSYMVLWMRKHSRDLKSDLQNAAGSALARGSAGALIAMAFLAVLREGFETAVFLLAAFQSALSPAQAAIGVILGIAVAVALGYLIYRGGIKLNLSRFFRITGVVLVLVAAGLVMSTLRAAYEAGWLTVGQQTWLNLSAIARPGSVQESLLTGMLGIRANLPVVEVVAYLLYAIPMLLVVLWPPKRTPSRQSLGRILVGTAAGALILAVLVAVLAPAVPSTVTGAQGPFALQGSASGGVDPSSGQPADGTVVAGSATITLTDGLGSAGIDTDVTGSTISATSALAATGHTDIRAEAGSTAPTVSATELTGTPITGAVDAAALGLPTSLTAQQIAELNGGRLPVGVRSGQAGDGYAVSYTDTLTPKIMADGGTGVVLGVELRQVRTVQVKVPDRGSVSAGTVLDVVTAATPAGVAAGLATVASLDADQVGHQVAAQVIPGLLVVFAGVLLAFGIPKLIRRRVKPPAQVFPAAPEPVPVPADSVRTDLAGSAPDRRPGG
ncbi:MAG: iron uptake transporter permease EfeU [Nakamurella sp.]